MNARARRGNGEGSVYERRDGRWVASVLDAATGRRRYAYAATETQAKRELRKMTTRSDTGSPALDAGATVAAYAAAWIADRAGRRRRESTVREYAYRLDRWILPELGRLRLREVTVVDVEDLLDKLVATGMTPGTVRSIRNALAAMLQDSVRARHLAVNVARSAQMPETAVDERERVEIPTDDQVHTLVREVAGTPLAPIVAMCAGTGARIGEVLGMRWSDVDLAGGVWRVSRTLTRDRNGTVVVGTRTKTGRVREVALPPDLVRALKAQRRSVAAARVKSAYWDESDDLVFPTSIGTPQDAHNVRRELKAHATAAGFPGSFHALRHWFASVAVTLAPDVTVAKVLGHAKVSTTTDTYAHLRGSDAERIAVAVSVAVKRGKR